MNVTLFCSAHVGKYVRNVCQGKKIKVSRSSKKTEGISRLARMMHVEETCTVSYQHKSSCSDGTVSNVQTTVWLNDTWRRPQTGIRAVRLVHHWLLESCMPIIMNQDKGVNLLCKTQSETQMKLSQTQQTWMKVSSLVLTQFLHLSITCFHTYLPRILTEFIAQIVCILIIKIFSQCRNCVVCFPNHIFIKNLPIF